MQPTIRFEHHLIALATEQTVNVMLELDAPEPPGHTERAALRLALVIDRSGSMAGDKLATTKECAAFLARRLSPADELAVITYDNDVDLVAPLAPVNPDALVGAINRIHPGGQTNLSGGWLKGVEVLSAATDGVRKVLLLTDGQANVGVTDPARLVRLATQTATTGIGTTTIGFGDDFDENLLTAMADGGTGNAHVAPSPDAAPAIFAAEFEGLSSVVAQNVSVEIRPGDDVAVVGVLNQYPATPVAGGVQLALGDAYGGDHRSVVFKLHIPALADLGPPKVAGVVLRYVAVGDTVTAHEVTIPLVVNVATAEDAAAAGPDTAVTEEVVILEVAQARDDTRRLAEEGDFDGSRSTLHRAAQRLRGRAATSAKADQLLAEAAQLEESATVMDQATFSPVAAKTLHYQSHQSRRRRQ
jgi:Ca-activated chloride channel family protein